jgi:hypothetical protein
MIAGTASATGPAGVPRASQLHLAYTCRFPSGPERVGVRVQATVPPAEAGQPIQATGVRTAVTLPRAAVAGLGAITVSGGDELATVITQDGHSVTAAWPGEMPPATPVPVRGDLVLTTRGPVPPVTLASPGPVSFTVGQLALALLLRKATGAPANPAVLRVACALGPRQDAQLATAVVTRPASSTPPASPSGSGHHDRIALGRQPGTRAGQAKFPPGCADIPVKGAAIPGCAYLVGFANANRLHGAEELGPGLLNIDLGESLHFIDHNKLLVENSSAELFHNGKHELPPFKATLLTFGFMPVTASIELSEQKPIQIVSESEVNPPFTINVVSTAEISIRIYNVMVNGAPLNVGSHCQTDTPFALVLQGNGINSLPPVGYTVSTGGPLTATVTIPTFSGCGVGENLDPLFNASISGPGNFTLQTQGQICFPSNPNPPVSVCPAPVPKPLRSVPPLPK